MRNSYDSVILRYAGLILLIVFCLAAMCGCAGEDKYVEIIIPEDGGEEISAPALKETAATDDNITSMMQTPESAVNKPESDAEAGKIVRPKETAKSAPTPNVMPTLTPAITPVPTLTPEITPTATPKPSETPAATAAPTGTPVITVTPDPEILKDKEQDDVYIEYIEEWKKLYNEYENKCASLISLLNYMESDPHPEDPEYAAEIERINAELDALAEEFAKQERELYFEYFGKYPDE